MSINFTEIEIINNEINYLVREYKSSKKDYTTYKEKVDKEKGVVDPFYKCRTNMTFGIMLAYEMSLKHLLYMIYGSNMDFDKFIEEYKE